MDSNGDSNKMVYSIIDSFLIEYEFVKNRHAIRTLDGNATNRVEEETDLIVNSLFYIRLVSALSFALSQYIKNKVKNCIESEKSLYHKLTFVNETQKIKYHSELHKIRERRNEIGHDNAVIKSDELDNAIRIVMCTLKELSLVSYIPNYTLKPITKRFERSDRLGDYVYNYCIIDKETNTGIECSWKITHFRPSMK